MRKIAILLLLLVPICLLGQKTRVYTVNFNEKDFTFEKDGDFLNIVSIDSKAVLGDDTLDLALPCIGVNILIDPTDDYAGVTYEGDETLIESNVLIEYNPEPLPTNVQQVVKRPRHIEYTKKTYPGENVLFTGTHIMDGYKFLSFVVFPFRYDAENKSLYMKKDISLRLKLKSQDMASNYVPKSLGKNMRDIVKNMTINGSELETIYHTESYARPVSTTYKYIIVTNELLQPVFEKLAHWKTIKGVRSKVITVEDCYDAYPNMTPQQAIKTVLASYYNNNGMEYALLGGDTDVVPAQICYLQHYSNTPHTYDTPADLYYACLDNCFSWDGNNNHIYGEDSDSLDYSPEFIITRSSVSTLAEAEIYVNRIIEYESSPKVEGWTKSILSCGHYVSSYKTKNNVQISDSQYYGEDVYENGILPYWNGTLFELFDTYSDHPNGAGYNATADHFQTEFEKGYTFIDEFSHGWVNKWGYLEGGSVYNNVDAESLTNSGYSIITTIACYTNAFDKIWSDFYDEVDYFTTSLSESFIRNPSSGVLAYFGSSREGWLTLSSKFDKEFYISLLSGDNKQFGRAAMLAKNAYLYKIPTTGYNKYRWLVMTLNPIGDPEMPVITEVPLSFNNVSVSFSNGNLIVTTGASGCTICVSSAADSGDSYYNTYNNVNGISLSGVNTDCYLCITKQGYIPYVARVGNSVYLQNEDIVRNLSVFSTNTYIGSSVNNSLTQGPVTIQKGKLINYSTESITIQNDFEVSSGAELEIIKP